MFSNGKYVLIMPIYFKKVCVFDESLSLEFLDLSVCLIDSSFNSVLIVLSIFFDIYHIANQVDYLLYQKHKFLLLVDQDCYNILRQM